MRIQTIYKLDSFYRNDMEVKGYYYGKGEPSICIMGGLRGNEIQQVYICSQLNLKLKQLERDGKIKEGKEILVIPTGNNSSINVARRFWPSDNTDINRMFPGYDQGETTQRIAAGIFEKIKDYHYGIQLTSSYMKGYHLPHVRIMHTGYEDVKLADSFNLPYTMIRDPKPYDTTTLNYNWQIWETNAFSLYTPQTEEINQETAKIAVEAILQFMANQEIIDYPVCKVENKVYWEKDLIVIKNEAAGFFTPLVSIGDHVDNGELLAEVIDPYSGDVIREITAKGAGKIFFVRNNPLVYANTVIFRIIPE